jgi:NAD(P)-dependent dehydrogenase (short-subunit alcohol dehydrogenase family)
MTPTGRLTEPGDIAATVRFLLSDGAAQITGQAIHVDGGLLLA